MKTKIKKKLKENAIGYGLLLPFLIGLIGFTVYPLGLALVQSFYKDYSPVTGYDPSALGIDNYVRALTDEWVLRSIKLTLVYAAITIPIGLIVSFFIAYLLTAPIKCSKLFRVLVYLPALIPGIVGASIYKYMFGPDEFGLFNQILIAMGQEPSQLLESKNQTIAVLCFFLTGIFSYGCTTPMWIAGLKSIPSPITALPNSERKNIHADYGKFCYKGLRHSLCHGWSSGFIDFFFGYVLGVAPTAVGYQSVSVTPHLCGLDFAEGELPTKYGNIYVSHELTNGVVKSTVRLPDGVILIK